MCLCSCRTIANCCPQEYVFICRNLKDKYLGLCMCQAKSYSTINQKRFLQRFPLTGKTFCNFLIKCYLRLCGNAELKKGSGLLAQYALVLIYPQKQTVQNQWLQQTSCCCFTGAPQRDHCYFIMQLNLLYLSLEYVHSPYLLLPQHYCLYYSAGTQE